MHSLKTASANWWLPLVEDPLLEEMKLDPDASRREFWKERYHATPLYDEDSFLQKLDYIHANPVRRGLSARPEEYPYSSARFYFDGVAREDCGLEKTNEVILEWPPELLPALHALRDDK